MTNGDTQLNNKLFVCSKLNYNALLRGDGKVNFCFKLNHIAPFNMNVTNNQRRYSIIGQFSLSGESHQLPKGAFHLSELIRQMIPVGMRISVLIKTIQPDQSNRKHNVRRRMFFRKKKLLKKAHFIVKMTGPAMVWPSTLTLENAHNRDQ